MGDVRFDVVVCLPSVHFVEGTPASIRILRVIKGHGPARVDDSRYWCPSQCLVNILVFVLLGWSQARSTIGNPVILQRD
jgi:hypothetical protein